jgi:Protein of unknown function (DUF3999)/F5/8 type C domain
MDWHSQVRTPAARVTRSFCLAALIAVTTAAQSPQDETRAAWRYRRALSSVTPSDAPLVALPLPPELLARAQPDLRDLRLVAADGSDVPYVVDRQAPREAWQRWSGRLADVQQEYKRKSVWTVDLGEPRSFGLIEIEVDGQDFAKRVRVEASDDGATWRVLLANTGLFERAWSGKRVRHTTIALPGPERARHLRLSADDSRSLPIVIASVGVAATWAGPEARWQRPARLRRINAPQGFSRYSLEAESLPPFESLELIAADVAFSRQVRLREMPRPNDRGPERVLGEATLYRVPLPEIPELNGESRELAVQAAQGGDLVLEIQDGDSPPLREPRVMLSGPSVRLVFPRPTGLAALYYDNDRTRPPLYDLAGLQWRLQVAAGFASATLGPEAENPRFARPAPLQGTPLTGAGIDVARWRFARSFVVSGAEDLYSFTLAPADLGRMQRDLSDLRLVDQDEHQLPYILEHAAAEERVALGLGPDAGPAARGAAAQASRYLLSVPAPAGARDFVLPLESVRLDVEQPFFARAARVLGDAGHGRRREREALLLTTTLKRSPGQTTPVELPLDGTPRRLLRLEIDEGDDRPLVLTAAWGVLRVPRVTFKVKPGTYRLLLGNDEAQAPRYDLTVLTREILALSAAPIELEPLSDNRAYRRRAADYFRNAPPTVLLWGALLAAVLGLVFMTARLLRQPPAP